MPDIPEKLTVRLGALREPLAAYCAEHDLAPSQAVREAVAAMLGEDEPDMKPGNPTFVKRR